MKFSYSWLKDFLPKLDVSYNDLADRLTMAGFERESVSLHSPLGDKVVVAYIVECYPHPNADRLRLCKVNVGQDRCLSIVCGASNVSSGMTVVCSLVGAVLPSGLTIKEATIRGELSEGMLCSADELGLPYSSNGILELSVDSSLIGSSFDLLCPEDALFDISVLPNRPDCLSVWGIAREIGAWSREFDIWTPSNCSEWDQAPDVSTDRLRIQSHDDCCVYYGALIEDISLDRPLPFVITHRLLLSGLKPVNTLVDLLNYSLLTWGQPFHAFDADKFYDGEIFVRRAQESEKINTISGITQSLDGRFLVIANSVKPQAIAGLIGSAESAISNETKTVFLEAACFNPNVCSTQVRISHISTDAGFRFERGVDPSSVFSAFGHVLNLVKQFCGGVIKERVSHRSKSVGEVVCIPVDADKINSLLGFSIKLDDISDLLFRAGLPNHRSPQEKLAVSVPSWRFDIATQEDLVEEISRIYGYENIPLSYPTLSQDHFFTDDYVSDKIKSSFILSGYHEVCTYAFCDPGKERWNSQVDLVSILNPIGKSMSALRSELLSGLVNILEYNIRRGVTRLKIFEEATCFEKNGKEIQERNKVSGLCYGTILPEQWGAVSQREIDIFDVKGDIERAMSVLLTCTDAGDNPFFHPTRSSYLVYKNEVVGVVGELHPRFKKSLNLLYSPVLFELYQDNFCTVSRFPYQPFSVHPKVVRDVCFWVPSNLPFQNIFDLLCTTPVAEDIVFSVRLFDVYFDQEYDARRSLAFRLGICSKTRTLLDSEVGEIVAAIVSRAESLPSVVLREERSL
ncbi:phenylalanine--tRNA ligase subunit beta [Candidatus Ichthyocystis sparus]|uniref:phenylalanine--tRNA ligase subunit beta n=1 Tax=Candidatus Ichthyocystis sparus TaxID=1561004 RepID=UPI000AE63FE9|nr:phenylalanine--tRNA ligase subunit beta [Candidatus Ichthyocystis sparus]